MKIILQNGLTLDGVDLFRN